MTIEVLSARLGAIQRLARVLFFLTIPTLLGCRLTGAEFNRYQSVEGGPLVETALQFYAGDAEALRAGGPIYLGTVDVRGNAFASFGTCADRAAEEAAEVGGTHFILLTQEFRLESYTTPGSINTTTTGSAFAYGTQNTANVDWRETSRTTYSPPQTHTISKPKASYVVFRVPVENWPNLPERLRPRRTK